MKNFNILKIHDLLINRNLLIIFFFFLIILASISCRPYSAHSDLIIRNNSSSTIALNMNQMYPDTFIACRTGAFKIEQNQEFNLRLGDGWEDVFKEKNTLQLFIIDNNIWQKEPCDTIRKYNKILKRYQLTYDDLERLYWTITYP
jgi:hypothetical protein